MFFVRDKLNFILTNKSIRSWETSFIPQLGNEKTSNEISGIAFIGINLDNNKT